MSDPEIKRYQEFEPASYTKLRKDLLQTKGSHMQRDFLQQARSGEQFSKWIRDRVQVSDGEVLPLLEERMSENQFKDPPKDTEEQISNFWKHLSPADASRVAFWGFVTLRHIEEGRIEPYFLAANGGNLPGGLERIDVALSNGGDEKRIDDSVRTILRRMGGLPEARGNRSVYVNCPFARAWWRGNMAEEVCENTKISKEKIVKVLRVSQEYWEELITLVVSQNSILGDMKIRTALIAVLSEVVDGGSGDNKKVLQAKTLKKIRYLIGVRSAWQELGVFTVEEIQRIIREEIIPNVLTGMPINENSSPIQN